MWQLLKYTKNGKYRAHGTHTVRPAAPARHLVLTLAVLGNSAIKLWKLKSSGTDQFWRKRWVPLDNSSMSHVLLTFFHSPIYWFKVRPENYGHSRWSFPVLLYSNLTKVGETLQSIKLQLHNWHLCNYAPGTKVNILPAVFVLSSWQPMRWARASIPFCPQGNQSPESPSNFPKVTQLGIIMARILSLVVRTPEAFGSTSTCRYSSRQGSPNTSHNPTLSIDCRTSGSYVKQLLPRSSPQFVLLCRFLKLFIKSLLFSGRGGVQPIPSLV